MNTTFFSGAPIKTLQLLAALLFFCSLSGQNPEKYAQWQTPEYEKLRAQHLEVYDYPDEKYDKGLEALQGTIKKALEKDPKNPLILLLGAHVAQDRGEISADVLGLEPPEEGTRWDDEDFSIAEKLRVRALYERQQEQSQMALQYLLQARPLGERQTLHALAKYYMNGYFPQAGVENNGTSYLTYKVDKEVVDLLERSYALGYQAAGYDLATVFLWGLGSIKQDTGRGEKIASALPNKETFYYEIALGFLESDSSNDFIMPIRSLHQASKYMHLAAQLGSKSADLVLSKSYLNGLGSFNFTPIDYAKAYFHSDRAANDLRSFPEAYYIKAVLMLHGQGVKENRPEALAMLLKLKETKAQFPQSQYLDKYIAQAQGK